MTRSYRTRKPRQQRATILVDIDGCLNAWKAPKILPTHNHIAQAGRYTVVLDHRHPGWFRELGEVADMRWASMWVAQSAPVFGSVANIGQDWPFLDFDAHNASLPWHIVKQNRTGNGVGSFKFPMIEALAEEDQPLVWIDDDMLPAHLEWARKRSAAGIPTLFIQPDPRVGVTQEEFEDVLAFAQRFALAEVAA